MKSTKPLMLAMTIFTILSLSACAPMFRGGHGGPKGMKLSADQLFTNADVNGDNLLSKDEFENSLPE